MYKAPTAERKPSEEAVALPPIFAQSRYWLAGPAAQQATSAVTGCARFANEWQSFVYRRLGEDVQLAARLSGAKSPAEAWGRYMAFLQKAAQDYWGEYATLAKLSRQIALVSLELPREGAETHEPAAEPIARAA